LDDAIVRGLIRPADLAKLLSTPGMKARPGSGTLRSLLETWRRHPNVQSVAEMAVLRVILAAGIAAPTTQHEVVAGERYVLDFAWPDLKIAVEVDGFRYHANPTSYEKDRHRDNALGELGWIVIRVTPKEFETRPDAFIANLLARISERQATIAG
jgi:very-short-patch-repair endonuclease